MDSKNLIAEHLEKVTELPNLITFFESHAKTQVINLKKGSFLANEGQPLERVFVITEGFVKLYNLSDDGKESVNYLLGPGYILGARAFIAENDCAIHSAEAITDLKVIALSHKDYMTLISNYPEYLVDLLQIFINRLVYTEKKLTGFVVGDAKSRIANFIIDTFERYADKSSEKKFLPLPLTHQRIAEFVGAIRETVTVVLNELKREQIIRDENSLIEILDLEKLRSLIK